MKRKKVLKVAGVALATIGGTLGTLGYEYKDRINVYTEPTIKLVTSLSVPCIEILSVDMPNTSWFSGESRYDFVDPYTGVLINNEDNRARVLFRLGENTPEFTLYEKKVGSCEWVISDFYPKKEIFLDQLATGLPKLAEYLMAENFNESNEVSIKESYSPDNRNRIMEIFFKSGAKIVIVGEFSGVKFEFPNKEIENYSPPFSGIKNKRKSLIKRIFRLEDSFLPSMF